MTNIPSNQLHAQLYNSCTDNIKTNLVNTLNIFFELTEAQLLETLEQIVTKIQSNRTLITLQLTSPIWNRNHSGICYLLKINCTRLQIYLPNRSASYRVIQWNTSNWHTSKGQSSQIPCRHNETCRSLWSGTTWSHSFTTTDHLHIENLKVQQINNPNHDLAVGPLPMARKMLTIDLHIIQHRIKRVQIFKNETPVCQYWRNPSTRFHLFFTTRTLHR